MHIPDNYLSLQTDAVLAAVMVPVWVRCARVVRERLDRRHLSFLGMAAAFSFLLMMFNVPLPMPWAARSSRCCWGPRRHASP